MSFNTSSIQTFMRHAIWTCVNRTFIFIRINTFTIRTPKWIIFRTSHHCLTQTNGDLIPCADGRCVASSDQCRPIVPCKENYVRCNDGSCRLNNGKCPLTQKACPSTLPYRCENGACALDESNCKGQNGCPYHTILKCQGGQCANSEEECDALYNEKSLPNGCSISEPYKCSYDSSTNETICALDKHFCPVIQYCPDETPILCPDKTCVDNVNKCSNQMDCAENQVLCPDNTCGSSWLECSTIDNNNCSMAAPFACENNQCKPVPFDIVNLASQNNEGCEPTIVCPLYRPYICADGECVGDRNFCKTYTPCPENQNVRCKDRTCVANESQCDDLSLCPSAQPILCSSGICAKNPYECSALGSRICPEDNSFECASGICAESPLRCLPQHQYDGSSSFPGEQSSEYDIGCNEDRKYLCGDGSCRRNQEDCSFFQGCRDVDKPYLCKTGKCVQSEFDCYLEDLTIGNCINGTQRCEDGICRNRCPNFNGCPVDRPLSCPNGFCAQTEAECAGESNCPSDRPFRCINNDCVTDRHLCSSPKRLHNSEDIILYMSPYETKTLDFIMDRQSNEKYAALKIASGALVQQRIENDYSNQDLENIPIAIRPFPDSRLMNLTNNINEKYWGYTQEMFPLYDGKTLPPHLTIRSTILNITVLKDNLDSYRFPMILTLAVDVPINAEKDRDFCLGQANFELEKWECAEIRALEIDNDNNKLSYKLPGNGIYAIIFNRQDPIAIDQVEDCDWICQYKTEIMITLTVLLIIVLIVLYSFWRIRRYVWKYRKQKAELDNLKGQIKELQDEDTEMEGQTVNDKLDGIDFTINPLYVQHQSEVKQQKIDELAKAIALVRQQEKKLKEKSKKYRNKNDEVAREICVIEGQIEDLLDAQLLENYS